MRIGLISTLATAVRQHGAGSVETLVWFLAREYTQLGHEVTVFGAAGSDTPGHFVATLPGSYAERGAPGNWQLCEWINLSQAVRHSHRFDVLHSHVYLWALPLQPLARAAMVHTLHTVPGPDDAYLLNVAPGSCLTAVSRSQWESFPEIIPSAIIHHGVDASQFTFHPDPDDYVCFLGRFTPGKGPLRAIEVARALGIRVVLAGPANDYFRQRVQPLVDGTSVEYIGPVGTSARSTLLGRARALLYPIESAESFGLVLPEAMMCGTPVVAIRLGAVAEIVDEGITGYSTPSLQDLADCVTRSFFLDRRRVRHVAESRFSVNRMACQYLEVYQRLLTGRPSVAEHSSPS